MSPSALRDLFFESFSFRSYSHERLRAYHRSRPLKRQKFGEVAYYGSISPLNSSGDMVHGTLYKQSHDWSAIPRARGVVGPCELQNPP